MLPSKAVVTIQHGSQGEKYYLLVLFPFTPLLIISYSVSCSYNKISGVGGLSSEKRFLRSQFRRFNTALALLSLLGVA